MKFGPHREHNFPEGLNVGEFKPAPSAHEHDILAAEKGGNVAVYERSSLLCRDRNGVGRQAGHHGHADAQGDTVDHQLQAGGEHDYVQLIL